jgi:uncharacterized protein
MKHALMRMAAAVLFLPAAAGAFTGALPDDKVIDTPRPAAVPALSERQGVLSWTVLADVRSVAQKGKMVSEFSSQIRALDKTAVRVQGFMIPLEAGASQKRFLLSASSPTCEFCIPGGPESLVEVRARQPVKYTSNPVIMSGNFVIAGNDGDGVLYRLTDADLTAP